MVIKENKLTNILSIIKNDMECLVIEDETFKKVIFDINGENEESQEAYESFVCSNDGGILIDRKEVEYRHCEIAEKAIIAINKVAPGLFTHIFINS